MHGIEKGGKRWRHRIASKAMREIHIMTIFLEDTSRQRSLVYLPTVHADLLS
jgi:hypothetical protein